MSPNGPVWDVYYYTSPPFRAPEGKRGAPRAEHSARLRETLCEIARGPPWRNLQGARGACSSKRGATLGPLWHSAIFPDPTFFEKSRFLKKLRNRLVSKIDLAGSRRVRRKYFSKVPGQYSPQRSLCQRGAPQLEPLLYSARFACPGMLIFANFEY